VRQVGEAGTIAALFAGEHFEVASREFEIASEKAVTCDVAELTAAIQAAASAVDAFLESRADRLEMEWSGAVRGLALWMTPAVAKLVWLGDVQSFLVRNRAIVNTVRIHTLAEALQVAGHANFDTRYPHALLKHLSGQHEPESTEWELRSGDAVIVCSPYIDPATVVQCLEETGVNGLARSIVDAAHVSESRIDHTVLALTVRA
jgi:hypothetical protein